MKDISETIEDVILSKINSIHTILPGRIEEFDGKVAKVKPLIKKKYLDGGVEALPVITNVPVIFPMTADLQITFPIKKGDECLILFSERDISNWIEKGEDSEPATSRKYDLTDAIIIPGLISPANNKAEYDETKIIIKYKETKIEFSEIEVNYSDKHGNNIKIDSTGIDFNASALKVSV